MTMAAPDTINPHTWAHRYAQLGLRVLPITPGRKSPSLPNWVKAATTNPATIDAWWHGLYRSHGIGIAPGKINDHLWWFVVDIDTHGHDGHAAWAELCDTYDWTPPRTVEAATGGGGTHLWFTAPVEIRNGRIADGVDIRGAGGQIVVHPTVHPTTNQPYQWVNSPADVDEIAAAPNWLIHLCTTPQTATQADQKPGTPPLLAQPPVERPGDLWARQTSWEQILTADGWTLTRQIGAETQWTRPGKTPREGISATVNHAGTDTLKVFTTSIHGLDDNGTYTKIGYLAATRFGGDHQAAARYLAGQGWSALPPIQTSILHKPHHTIPASNTDTDSSTSTGTDTVGRWNVATPDDITAILNGTHTQTIADTLQLTDQTHLIYTGKVNSLSGEPSTGKTWIALHAAHQQISNNNNIMIIDFEDTLTTTVQRLATLGTNPTHLAQHLHYIEPGTAARGGSVPPQILDLAATCTLVIIDSSGEAMAAVGSNQMDDNDVATWLARVPRTIAKQGPAVLLLDHVTKDTDNRGRWAIGSQRKLAGITGIAINATTITAFAKDRPGRIKLTCAKDRPGNHHVGATIAEITVTPQNGALHIEAHPPQTTTQSDETVPRFRPTHLMEQVSRTLEAAGPTTKNTICKSINSKRIHVIAAIECLIEEGHITVTNGQRGALICSVETPFRDSEIAPPNDLFPPVPTCSPPVPGTGAKTDPPVPTTGVTPLKGGDLVGTGQIGCQDSTRNDPTCSRPERLV